MRTYAVLFLSFCLAGCLANRATPDNAPELDVFGATLGSKTDFREIRGVTASEEPCLRGYERSFDPLDIAIGYGLDTRIRKITTRNPGTRIFGIAPGMPAATGKRLALRAGFTTVSPDRFRRDTLSLVLQVDATDTIFGIAVEADD